MIAAELPPNEKERLAVLRELGVLDTPEVASLDELVGLAARVAGVPIALISLIDEKRQWFLAHHGLAMRETPRDLAFCAHAILDEEQVFVVNDTRQDARFSDNPLVTGDPRVVFYAGAPLVVSDHAVGTLCLIDHAPRRLSDEARETLRILARQVEARLVLSKAVRDKNDAIEALVRSEAESARLSRVLDLLPQRVLLYERDDPGAPFRLISRNRSALALSSTADNVEVGMLARDQKPRAMGAAIVQQLEAAVAAREAGVERIVPLQEIAGRSYQVETIALSSDMVALVAEEVTQRVAFERSKDEFLAIAAHELRTPLSGMIGAMGLLSGGAFGDLPEGALEAVTIAEDSALRLTRLTTDMLDLETMRQGRLTLRPSRVTTSELLALTLPTLRAAGAGKGVELVARGDLETEITIDRDRIVQVLTNFVSNAIRYAPPQSEVTVTATKLDGAVRIDVADRGAGISPQDQARLFQRFVQIEDANRRPHQGTGLGLAIVKGIVELHGGRVGVESEPSVRPGTRFWLELPAT